MSRHHNALQQSKWQLIRHRVFKRDHWRCVQCGKAGKLECDHRVPLHVDPKQDLYAVDGLQTLCRSCHIEKTARENRKPLNADQKAWLALRDLQL